MTNIQSWSELFDHRKQIKMRYPEIWDIPLVKKEMDRMMPHLREGIRILEMGAGDRRYEAKIRKTVPGVTYKSLDIDKKTDQDYYHIGEIEETFDLILMFEVIEHLTLGEAAEMFKKIRSLLVKGGTLLLSTPNLYHPNRYFDITHKTPFRYEDLGATMLMAGFNAIHFYRMYNDAFLRRSFRTLIGIHLHKYLEMDFARTLLAEGKRD